MKALKVVIVILVILLGIFLIPPLFMPGELEIKETHVLKAKPEVIWNQVACMKNWEKWDTWHQDTNMTGYYEGPECGVGSKNIWSYKNVDDGGSQTIVEAKEFEYIKTQLDFRKMGTADAEFFFEETDEGTKITWTLLSSGKYPTMRWINTLFIKPGVTKAYQEGLKNLDELTKDMVIQPKYTTGKISVVEVKSMPGLALNSKVSMDELGDAMGAAFGKLMGYIQENNIQMAGPPLAIWYKWEEEIFDFDNVIPVASNDKGSGDIKAISTYGGKALTVDHFGNYNTTQYSWMALDEYLKNNELELNGDPYEVYINDPQTEPDPSEWHTKLYWPVK